MKNTRLLILAASLLACSLNLRAAEALAPVSAAWVREIMKAPDGAESIALVTTTMTKERDEAKAALAALQSQQQLQNLATEFYKASSEKNAALLQLVSALQQLETARTELAAARAEIETLKAAKK